MDKMKNGEGYPHQQELFEEASPSQLDVCYDPGQPRGQTQIKMRTGHKLLRYQSGRQRQPAARRRTTTTRKSGQQHCLLADNRESGTASEPSQLAIHRQQQPQQHQQHQHKGLDDKCASASELAAGVCPRPRQVPYNLRPCAASRPQGAAEEPGRKAQGKRKNVERAQAQRWPSPGAESGGCPTPREERRCLNTMTPKETDEGAGKRSPFYAAGTCPKRPLTDEGHPLKRTYADTCVNDQPDGSDQASSQESEDACDEGSRRGPRKRRRQPPSPRTFQKVPRRLRGGSGRPRCAVLLSDAQTQTDSSSDSCCCASAARRPASSRSPARRPGACKPSSSSSSGSSCSGGGGSSSQLSAGEGTSSSQSESCSDEQRGAPKGTARDMAACGLGAGPAAAVGSLPRDRRRFTANLSTQPRRHRRSSPRVTACQPQRSQDNWGCLIF